MPLSGIIQVIFKLYIFSHIWKSRVARNCEYVQHESFYINSIHFTLEYPQVQTQNLVHTDKGAMRALSVLTAGAQRTAGHPVLKWPNPRALIGGSPVN